MPPGEPRVGIATLRAAVREAGERTSWRAVARAVGVTHPALLAFVEGAEPRDSTLRKLSDWFVRHRAAIGGDDAETTAAALAVLLRQVPEARREQARREVLDAVERACTGDGAPAPEWVQAMREG